MSKFSDNYEKFALGGALAVALGLAAIGIKNKSAVDEDLRASDGGKPSSAAAVAGAEDVSLSLNSLAGSHKWEQGDDEGRPVNLFTGIALFAKRDAAQPVDLLKGEPVHPPIPNQWWLENNLDPGFADSAHRDADEDGFTNLEEFEAKSNPSDAKSYPPLIGKLAFNKEESVTWLLLFSSDLGEGQYQFKYEDTKGGQNRSEYVANGANIFAQGAAANRFKLISVTDQVTKNETTGVEETLKIAKVEDQSPNKKGTTYEVPRRMRDPKKYYHFDRTAVLDLKAIGEAGKEFKVEEGTRFALPSTATEKNYLLKKVTPDAVTVEFKGADGATQTKEISRAK